MQFFPKLHTPFERETRNSEFVVVDEVTERLRWVFDEAESVTAVEKLDGRNIRVDFDDGRPVAIYQRDGYEEDDDYPNGRKYNLKEIPLFDESYAYYTRALANTFSRGWGEYITDGPNFGELVGPKVESNRYDLDRHYWVPFEFARTELAVESYGEYDTDFDTISGWFESHLPPLFYTRMHGSLSFDEARERHSVEGLVFVRDDGTSYPDTEMAKLRRSDFGWYYE